MLGHIKKLIFLICFLLILTPIIFSGCGVLNPAITNSAGYYTRHFWSCGPDAVSDALRQFNIYRSRTAISMQMQDNSNTWRNLLTLIHKTGGDISCPHEIITVCKQYGYTVLPIRDIHKLDATKDIALVLISSGIASGWHWVCFPVVTDIENFYGDNTMIHRIFILKDINIKSG